MSHSQSQTCSGLTLTQSVALLMGSGYFSGHYTERTNQDKNSRGVCETGCASVLYCILVQLLTIKYLSELITLYMCSRVI